MKWGLLQFPKDTVGEGVVPSLAVSIDHDNVEEAVVSGTKAAAFRAKRGVSAQFVMDGIGGIGGLGGIFELMELVYVLKHFGPQAARGV